MYFSTQRPWCSTDEPLPFRIGEVAALKGKGETITPEKEAELLNRVRSKYEETFSPYYAASRLWLDAVIHPLETRTWVSLRIEGASQAPAMREFNMGVLQT